MALQNGTELAVGSHEITAFDVIEVTSDMVTNGVTLNHTPVGATGSEIGFAYLVNEDGSFGTEFTQDATASATTFTYADGAIKFGTDAIAVGDRVACAYTYKSATTAERITLETDTIPGMALVTCFGVAKDVCSEQTYPCQLEGIVQIDGNWNLDLSADGDPVVQSVNMEFVRSCLEKRLYTFTVYTEDE